MQRIMLNLLMFIGDTLVLVAGGGSNGNDVSKDLKYADIYHQIFNTTQSLYYYYTHSDGGKSGYFLSSQLEIPSAELNDFSCITLCES